MKQIIYNIDIAIKEGRKQKLNEDEFALFMADIIQSIDNYNFDVFYDIAKILEYKKAYQGEYCEHKKDNFLLLVRSTGCDMVKEDNELIETYKNRSDRIYKLSFFWNVSYFYSKDNHFCTITKTK